MNSDVKSPRSAPGNILRRSVRSVFSLLHNSFQNFEWASLLILAILPTEAFEAQPDRKLIFFFIGILPFAVGLLLRVWSRGFDKSDGFVLGGPYRYVQNPDELGSLLMYMGAYLLVGMMWSWVIAFCVILFLYFTCVATSYEDRLRKKVGLSFPRYRSRVNRWLPSFYPAVNRSPQKFLWQKALRKEISTWLWLLGLVGVMLFRNRS